MLPNGVDGLTRQCRVQKFSSVSRRIPQENFSSASALARGLHGMGPYTIDILAVAFFIVGMVYAVTLERTAYGPRQPVRAHQHLPRSLGAPAARSRDWSTCRSRPQLQNGTAFFASTSLFAIGVPSRCCRAGNEAATLLSRADRPQPLGTSAGGQVRRAGADLRLRPFLNLPAVVIATRRQQFAFNARRAMGS